MKITFSSMLSTFVVHAPEGTLVSLSATPTEIGDGVYAVGDSGIVLVDEEYQTDTIYLSTEGEDYTVETGERICYPAEDIVVWGGNAPDRNPFPKSGKGGGGSGGDNTHYKGTTTTAISNGSTTNPITIDGESYTAVFGDIVVYNYTEFVFDGTKWSEFGRPFDTTPTSGSANAVTSDGIYQFTNAYRTWIKGAGSGAVSVGYNPIASGARSIATGESTKARAANSVSFGNTTEATGAASIASGYKTLANQSCLVAIGTLNSPRTGDLFNIGNGTSDGARSNIVEVDTTSLNVNGDIQQNGVPLRATTMPIITSSMLGKVVQYVGTSDSNYKQGWNYVAVSDGAAEPTYSWRALMDSTPTSGSNNPVTSDGIYQRTPWVRGSGGLGIVGGYNCTANRSHSLAYGANSQATNIAATALGNGCNATQPNMLALGIYNSPRTGDLFNIGNGSAPGSRSNILEANSTSVNINGDIQKNGVSLPTPYTTMPTITAAMLGQIAMYVGTTDANYTQGWFYIASSDGAVEPTYSWVHLPTQNGYSETVLYTASSPHTNNIELSQAYTNFDDIVVVWAYSAMSGGEYHNRFQQAFKTSALVADDNILVGEATSGGDFTAYTVVDATHINFIEKAGTYYNWISKVIGIKYGSNGGAVANPVRSLAKSEEKEKPIEEEEPTDEMR